jgi:hypothetical protein
MPPLSDGSQIDQSISIMGENEQIPNPRKFPLNSRAQISDGSMRRFFAVLGRNLRWKISALPWLKTIEWE